MTVEECNKRWLIQIEQIICLTGQEFMILNEGQLNYRLHVRHCNIRQIIMHLIQTNARIINRMKQSLPKAYALVKNQEYKPSWAGRYFLAHARFTRCIYSGKRKNGQAAENSGVTNFTLMLNQESELKEIIALSAQLDMNRKVVPFRLSGLIKLSMAETLEYIMLCQKSHITLARHLLKIQ